MIEFRAPFKCFDSSFHDGRDRPHSLCRIQLTGMLDEPTSPVRAEANNEVGFAEYGNIRVMRR